MNIQKVTSNKYFRIFAVLFLEILICSWTIVYFRRQYLSDNLLSTSSASQYLLPITAQAVIACLPEILILLGCLVIMGRRAHKAFYLQIPDKKSAAIVIFLSFVYVLCLFIQLIKADDKITVLFRWFYYLFAIAFMEEFTFRSVMPALLHGVSGKYLYWLLPSAMFALSHSSMLFVFGSPLSQILLKTLSNFLGYLIAGMAWEWCKRKTGSLFPGVLIHAVLDFGFIFGF